MLPPKQLSILLQLSTYKFLTRIQMARLGVDRYNSTLSRNCKPLVEAKYIGFLDAKQYGLGHMYYLTKRGALFVKNEKEIELETLNYCINKPSLSSQSIFHRTAAIDCQIEMFDSCQNQNISIAFYDRDIEALGNTKRDNNLQRKTRILIGPNEHLEPDAIFMLNTPKGKKLYCLEYEHKDYSQKSFKKLIKHVKALNFKSASKKYGHDKAHRTLFIYDNSSTMHSVMKRLQSEVPGIRSWFLFKSIEEVRTDGKFKNSIFTLSEKKNFLAGWQQANGERKMLY